VNFLQITQRLRRKCRVSGTGPTTVVGAQVEEYARLIDWANEAWMYIQTLHPDWLWMRKSTSFTTTTLVPTYSIADIKVLTPAFNDFGNWQPNTFRNFVTAVGQQSEITMEHIDYEAWRNTYAFGAPRFTSTRPLEIAVGPGQSLNLGPTPITGYTISGDYFSVPTEMAIDTDTPVLPTQFHMAIVYKAMMFYGASESAAEVYQEGEAEFGKMLRSLANQQLNAALIGGALA
jgi:hypothetical protein